VNPMGGLLCTNAIFLFPVAEEFDSARSWSGKFFHIYREEWFSTACIVFSVRFLVALFTTSFFHYIPPRTLPAGPTWRSFKKAG
jgi:hypothetical protein